jgi:nitrite reductase (NADH) small subunit
MPWVEVGAASGCPPGSSLEVVAGDRILAIFNVAGTLYAIDGVCPHQGGPLGSGELSGCIVSCPWHGWQFDVRTGQHQLNRNFQQPKFDVKVSEGSIWVDLPGCGNEPA